MPANADALPGLPVATLPPFSAIYSQYFDFVWSSARRLGVQPDAMDDIVQEVFVVIHARVHTVREPEALRSWIYGVVRRTVSEHHRSERARATSGAELAVAREFRPAQPPSPLELTEQNDQLVRLESVLQKLDEQKREVFILAELHELTAPEIARLLEIPLNTVYSRLRHARQEFELALSRQQASDEKVRA